MVTEFEKALMHRDEVDREEAKRQRAEATAAIYEILEDGGDYDDVEELLASEYGLEMDYIFDILG